MTQTQPDRPAQQPSAPEPPQATAGPAAPGGGRTTGTGTPVAAGPTGTASGPLSERLLSGLLVDWGGVLTSPLDDAMAAWASRDGVEFIHFQRVMAGWVGERPVDGPQAAGPLVGGSDLFEAGGQPPETDAPGRPAVSPVHALERGEMTREEFEVLLADALTGHGSPVVAEGLLDRLLGGLLNLSEEMSALVRRARTAGVRTALLSNSWGDHYPRQLWDGLFDEIVISGRVGMRKPEPEIYLFTARALGLQPTQCVMVDDLPLNVRAAQAVGMRGVLFRSYAQVAEELEELFGIPLR